MTRKGREGIRVRAPIRRRERQDKPLRRTKLGRKSLYTDVEEHIHKDKKGKRDRSEQKQTPGKKRLLIKSKTRAFAKLKLVKASRRSNHTHGGEETKTRSDRK